LKKTVLRKYINLRLKNKQKTTAVPVMQKRKV